LKHRCLKWARMTHLSTSKTSYDREKGWESKCQNDSRPLKVKNHLKLRVCKWHGTYHSKDLGLGYNFLNLTPIEGLHKKL
jgi:hypothetical protein